MAVSNLSHVTKAIINLLTEVFRNSSAWGGLPPAIQAEPPARFTEEGLGCYLYHVLENKTYANFPNGSISGQPSVRHNPLALNLYYQVSANSLLDNGAGPINEQLMMGIAMKAFHDYPSLNDHTEVNGVNIFSIGMLGLLGKDNNFKISSQPIPYNEAVTNWTAGAAPIRLSAYYEVSVVFLEPEEPVAYAGRVLSYGNYIFTEGTPRITRSQSFLSFPIPGQPAPMQVKLQPAQAPPGNEVHFFGSGFNGEQFDLRLSRLGSDDILQVTAPWSLTMTGGDQVTITVREQAVIENSAIIADVLPGNYVAALIVTRTRSTSSGEVKTFRNVSNEFPFIVSPRIDNILYPPGTIVTVNGYIFQHPELPPERIEVYIGEISFRRNTGGPIQAGEFIITAPDTINIHLPVLISGQILPVRILVAGAESPPNWITIL